jgi:hypothetical protein
MSDRPAKNPNARDKDDRKPTVLTPSPIRISTPPVRIIGSKPRYRGGFRLRDR